MDIKDFKDILMEKLAPIVNKFHWKKAETAQEEQTANAQQSSQPLLKGRMKARGVKLLVFASLIVICFVIGGVLAYNFYFSYDKDVRHQLELSIPNRQSLNTASNAPVPTGDTPVKNEQTQGEPTGTTPQQQDTKQFQEPSDGVQEKAKKAVPVRVSEHDPFKSEFEKKYQTALKKEKEPSSSLTDLEGAIKESKTAALPPLPPPPPPPPAPKQLKLSVYGTVVSSKDTYAITDIGVIRVGDVVEAFTVESIGFDVVTLRQNDNKNEVRNVFVRQDRSRQPSGGGAMPIHTGGSQWPSSQ